MGALDRKLVKGWRFAAREVGAVRAQRREVGIRRALGGARALEPRARLGPGAPGGARRRVARIESEPPAAPRDEETLGLARARPRATRPTRAASWSVTRRVAASSEWVDALAPSQTLVSVVVPTRNRARLRARGDRLGPGIEPQRLGADRRRRRERGRDRGAARDDRRSARARRAAPAPARVGRGAEHRARALPRRAHRLPRRRQPDGPALAARADLGVRLAP